MKTLYRTACRLLAGFIVVMTLLGFVSASKAQTDTDTQEAAAGATDRFVTIDFNNVDINVFIKFISELTGTNFVVDQRVKGKVTIISPTKISVDEAFKVFESVLEVHGFSTVSSGEVTKIIPAPEARTKSIETRLMAEAKSPDDQVVTQLIPLTYADPEEVKRLFTPLVSKSSVILSYPPTNMLIVTDVYSNIARLMTIVKNIDVAGIGQEISVIPLSFSDATKLVKVLDSVFQSPQRGKKGAQVGKQVKFVADERTNTVVAIASEVDTQRIKELIALLDKETPRGTENIRVYYLENATAEDLAKVLQEIPTKETGQAAATKAAPKAAAPALSDKVRITADKATNSLIIMAAKDDYLVIEDIIKKLDIPRSMVYIESLIMEVNVSKDFNLGVEWATGGTTDIGNRTGVIGGGFAGPIGTGDPGFTTISNPLAPIPLPPGFSVGVFTEAITIGNLVFPNIASVVNAYKKDRDVQILSTPQILTLDNEEAKITVGRNIPFQTRSTTTNNDTFSSFEYRDVGKILTITPNISQDRMVRLKISLEVTALESSTDFRPTTLKRTIDTTVIVRDGATLVVGGLIDNNLSTTQYRVPCLGEVPGLGRLFSSKSDNNTRDNLYVFLTPRVVENQGEASSIADTKKEEIQTIQEGVIKLYKRQSTP